MILEHADAVSRDDGDVGDRGEAMSCMRATVPICPIQRGEPGLEAVGELRQVVLHDVRMAGVLRQ
jgi:hypothetical protein